MRIFKYIGEFGYRSRLLPYAKRALYPLMHMDYLGKILCAMMEPKIGIGLSNQLTNKG